MANSSDRTETIMAVAKYLRPKIINAGFKFAFNSLHQYISKNPKNNIFFSPHLIYQNLFIIYIGTSDDNLSTKSSLKRILHIPDNIDKSTLWFYYITKGVLRFSYTMTKSAYTCRIFSRLWVSDCKELDQYAKLLSRTSHRVTKNNFNIRADGKRTFINNCIKSVTESCIQDLLPPQSIHSKTDIVMTNAIYFKTNIEDVHLSRRNENSDDTKNDGNSENKNVDQNDKSKPNKPDKLEFIIQQLSSSERNVSMFYLYIKDDSKIEKSDKIMKCLEYLMTDEGLKHIRRDLDSEELRENTEQFPTFKFVQDLRMYELLELLGVPELTPSGTAYLKNHFSTHDLKLGDTVHRASIEITTDHVIAAASNAFFTDNPSQHEHVDIGGDYVHLPSICLIYDKEHQNILFCGAMLKEMKETAI